MRVLFPLTLLLIAMTASKASGQSTGTTILTFEGLPSQSNLPDDYGDNVSAASHNGYLYGGSGGFTPNITMEYAVHPGPLPFWLWHTGYGDLTDFIWGWISATSADIRFVAEDGFAVELHGLDLGARPGPVPTIPRIRVRNENGAVLFEQISLTLPQSNQGHLDLDFSSPIKGRTLTLTFDLPSNGLRDIGIDNISFSQRTDGAGTGQANSSTASLRVNGAGALGVAGPFDVVCPRGGGLSFDWMGPGGQPVFLFMGPPNPAPVPFGCTGIPDIGTPPTFFDAIPLFFGILGSNGAGQLQVPLPAWLTGELGHFQSIVLQPASCPMLLTATFHVSVHP